MPTKLGVLAILVFWLVVIAHMVDREVLPRYAHDMPSVQIDVADEATRSVPGRWGVFRDGIRLGTLTTTLEPIDADGTFAFHSYYHDLAFSTGGVNLSVKTMTLSTIVHRDGRLAGQSMSARLGLDYQGLRVNGTVNVNATVVDGVLQGRCVMTSSVLDLDEPLPPRSVPLGPVLHSLQPMNRLKNVRPGQRWVVREVNPLGESMAILGRQIVAKFGSKVLNFGGDSEAAEYLAEVQPDPVVWTRRAESILCWRIDYRGKESTAQTWVAVNDGKVLRQEAKSFGETLRLERED